MDEIKNQGERIKKLKAQFNAFEMHFYELKAEWANMIAELETQEGGSNDSQSIDMPESKQDFTNPNEKQTSAFSFGSAFSKFKEKASEAKEAIEKSGVLDKVKEKTSELASKGLKKSKEFVESKKEKGVDNEK